MSIVRKSSYICVSLAIVVLLLLAIAASSQGQQTPAMTAHGLTDYKTPEGRQDARLDSLEKKIDDLEARLAKVENTCNELRSYNQEGGKADGFEGDIWHEIGILKARVGRLEGQ